MPMIRIYPDTEALSLAASELITVQAVEAARAGGRFSLVLSGGHTPRHAYELLALPPARDRIPWDDVHVFWGDERCVPPKDPRSNERMVREVLLNRVPIPAVQIHPIRCSRSPEDAAKAYESTLKSFFASRPPVFDMILLGLGADGHTASLVPGSDVLFEQKRWVSVAHNEGESFSRITLTLPIINRASLVVFLVAGKEKSYVLSDVLKGSPDPHPLPARRVRPTEGRLIWLVDKEAGAFVRDLSEG